jgi:N-glycosylase/DNA lyase
MKIAPSGKIKINTHDIIDYYYQKKTFIEQRLQEFINVPEGEYFYELCFCICTPQSSARNALQVVNKLKQNKFFEFQFDPINFLRLKEHYIRFHNTKSKRLLNLKHIFPQILEIIKSKKSDQEKRLNILSKVNGLGMKETSHFMRNIGYRNLAILDRHILKNLTILNIFQEIPKVGTINKYLEVEQKFQEFSKKIHIPMDDLDLLFWSLETGEILK